MPLRIITISRQYGSGGRAIGHAVAEKLGIEFYDHQILLELAEKSGYTVDFIETRGEYKTSSALDYASLGTGSSMRIEPSIALTNSVVNLQNELIVKLANTSPCVIVGRAADYLLRKRDDVLNVFIHADENTRIHCIAEKYEKISLEEAQKVMKNRDRQRKRHYRYYTDRCWGASELYHLCIDTGKISPSVSVELLCNIYRRLNEGGA